MTTSSAVVSIDRPSYFVVADNVRAELSRARWSGRAAAKELGWSTPYMARRLSGSQPFDAADLIAVAALVRVPVAVFFEDVAGGNAETAPTREGESRTLPEEDSNFQPAGMLPGGTGLAEVIVLRPSTWGGTARVPEATAVGA